MKPERISYLNGRITIDPDICNGKPTIRGKRITVHTLLDFLGAGESQVEILRQYPSFGVGNQRCKLSPNESDYSNKYNFP